MTPRLPSLRITGALLALVLAAACEVDFVPRAEAKEEFRKSYTAAAGTELTIENTNGKITVRAGSGPGIEIVATRIAKAGTDEAAKKLLADTKIEETVSGSSIKLSNDTGRIKFGGTQYEVNYEVRAPIGLALKLSATNGEIDVEGWEGRVEMSATNGSLEGRALTGEVDARTTNGKIDVRFARLPERGVKVEATNGEISVTLPKDAKGRVVARVTHGDINVDGLNVQPSPANTRRRYEADLNGGGGATVSIETTNGGVNVRGS
jgi:DUF4097 and DUF4098 domain-containing protein YvlB